jgi:hypothetical protein
MTTGKCPDANGASRTAHNGRGQRGRHSGDLILPVNRQFLLAKTVFQRLGRWCGRDGLASHESPALRFSLTSSRQLPDRLFRSKRLSAEMVAACNITNLLVILSVLAAR